MFSSSGKVGHVNPPHLVVQNSQSRIFAMKTVFFFFNLWIKDTPFKLDFYLPSYLAHSSFSFLASESRTYLGVMRLDELSFVEPRSRGIILDNLTTRPFLIGLCQNPDSGRCVDWIIHNAA